MQWTVFLSKNTKIAHKVLKVKGQRSLVTELYSLLGFTVTPISLSLHLFLISSFFGFVYTDNRPTHKSTFLPA